MRDPYERRYVYVADSGVEGAGEGLWAREKILQGQACALFNGVRQHRLWGCTAMSMSLPWSDYRIGCGEDLDLDILPCHVSTINYKATLAHKTCTSFTPNCHFSQFWHPRFGKIMAVIADKDISRGEEIFVCYNYVIGQAPEWYQEQWFTHVRKILLWTEERLHRWSDKMGLARQNIPPPEDKNRF